MPGGGGRIGKRDGPDAAVWQCRLQSRDVTLLLVALLLTSHTGHVDVTSPRDSRRPVWQQGRDWERD